MAEWRSVHYSGYSRQAIDFYATPRWITEALLKDVHLREPVWEPCCESGAMTEVLFGHGYTAVVSTDIGDYG